MQAETILTNWVDSLPSNIRKALKFENHSAYYQELIEDFAEGRYFQLKMICAACIHHFFIHHTKGELSNIGSTKNIAEAFNIAPKLLYRCWTAIESFETERLYGAIYLN